MTPLAALAATLLSLSGVVPTRTSQVAYSRLTDGYWQIWVFDLASSAQRQVTRSPSDKHTPAWTPDGSLVFRSSGDSLYRVPAGGGRERFQRLLPLLALPRPESQAVA